MRVSVETKIELAQIAESKGEGVKISDVVRDAIGDMLRRRAKRVRPDAEGKGGAE